MISIFQITMALSAIMPLATAAGFTIMNSCSYEVYLARVPGGGAEVDLQIAPGAPFTDPWTELPPGDGWAYKMSSIPNPDESTQVTMFEYNVDFNNSDLYFDMSEINGHAFEFWYLSGTDGCTPNQDSYYCPQDNGAVQMCYADASITLQLCAGPAKTSGTACGAGVGSTVTSSAGQATSYGTGSPSPTVTGADTTSSAFSSSSSSTFSSSPTDDSTVNPTSQASVASVASPSAAQNHEYLARVQNGPVQVVTDVVTLTSETTIFTVETQMPAPSGASGPFGGFTRRLRRDNHLAQHKWRLGI